MSDRYQAQRLAELRQLYDSLPVEERERIDLECKRLEAGVIRIGPQLAFEVVMSIRRYAVRMVQDG